MLLTASVFLREFSDFISTLSSTSKTKLLIVGDFNFHFENLYDSGTARLKEILDFCNLDQYVNSPTHIKGHTLDLVIARASDNLVKSVTVDCLMTDHVSILCKLNLRKPPFPKQQISYRKVKDINHDRFAADIKESLSAIKSSSDLTDIVNKYNSSLRSILDSHAPLKSRMITIRPSNPWYTPGIDEAKKLRKRLERKWRRSKLEVDREVFITQRQYVYNMIYEAKANYYKDKIANCADQKELYKIVDGLLHRKGKPKLPSHNSLEQLSHKFNDFFVSKIVKIRNALDSDPTLDDDTSTTANDQGLTSHLDVFSPASEEEIYKIIKGSPSKSCDLDPIPTSLLKHHLDQLTPLITRIVNLSLESAVFPSCFKKAYVTPLLKKPSLDADILKNYRPVSNLHFISKIIEKVVSSRITDHLASNNLYECFQSAYRKYHGTETALLRVQNDILRDLDRKRGVFLVLLDLSAAFDTIDHGILLSRLSSFGIRNHALQWIRSYLTDRMQAVNINGCLSSFIPLLFGVPQGSVLGPQFFTIYSSPIANIARKHGLNVHMYADDTQLYVSFKLDSTSDDESASRSLIESCIKDIKSWMTTNKLKLNDDKTEFLVITSKHNQSKYCTDSLQIATSMIKPTASARNLGIVFDNILAMDNHIKNVCKSTYFHIRNLYEIRKILDQDTASLLVHALITSRLDNGNSLLYGITDKQINKLQRVQNAAARMLTRTRKFDHITPVLQRLHWLPIKFRIQFKVILLTWKAFHDKAPVYINELVHFHNPSRHLRSSDKRLLSVPRTFSSYGDRAFYACAPKLWNSLPSNLRFCNSLDVFKKTLKTHLFRIAYDN